MLIWPDVRIASTLYRADAGQSDYASRPPALEKPYPARFLSTLCCRSALRLELSLLSRRKLVFQSLRLAAPVCIRCMVRSRGSPGLDVLYPITRAPGVGDG